MLSSFRTFLGTKVAQLRLSFSKKHSVPVNDILRPGKNILICLPEDGNGAEALELLKTELRPQNILLFAKDSAGRGNLPAGVKTFSAAERGLGFLTLPKRSLIREARRQGIDIAIDLHWRFSLPSAYLCASSTAPLRIGFYSPQGHHFFNLEYHARRDSPEICHELIRMLGQIGALASK